MHPVLFSETVAGTPLTVLTYPTLLLLAVAACSASFLLLSRRLGLQRGAAISFLALTGAALLLGARATAVLDDVLRSRQGVPELSGFSVIGGLVAASLAGLLFAKRRGLPLWPMADAAAPGIALGIALGKLACLAEGCCFGTPWSGAPALRFPAGSPAWSHQVLASEIGPLQLPLPVWPAQPLEAIIVLALLLLVVVIRRQPRLPAGASFLALAAGYPAARLALEPLRAVHSTLGIAILIAALAAAIACSVALLRSRAA